MKSTPSVFYTPTITVDLSGAWWWLPRDSLSQAISRESRGFHRRYIYGPPCSCGFVSECHLDLTMPAPTGPG
jgi:hypothetical protein